MTCNESRIKLLLIFFVYHIKINFVYLFLESGGGGGDKFNLVLQLRAFFLYLRKASTLSTTVQNDIDSSTLVVLSTDDS